MDRGWARRPWRPPSTRTVGGQVDVGAVGPARVEPAVQLHVDDQADQGFPQLGHGQWAPGSDHRGPDLPPLAHRLRHHAKRVSRQPFPQAREGLDEDRLGAHDRGVRRQVALGGGHGEIEDRADDNSASAVLGFDGGRLQAGGPPAHLLHLFEQSLQHLGPPERGLPCRLLQGEHRRPQLVAEPTQKVVALVMGEALAGFGGLPRCTQAALLRPTHQPAVEYQGLQVFAWGRELEAGGTMADLGGDRLQAAGDANPHRRGCAHHCDNGGYVRIRAGTVNLNVVPRRSLAATQIRPPNDRSTTRRHRYRPRPSPPCDRLRPAGPVFSNTVSRVAGGRPWPLSATLTSSQPLWTWRASTCTEPAVYSSALPTRLVSTRPRRPGLQEARRNPPG